MADNVTYAYFANGKNTVVTSNLWQYDYGQILVISGVTLPQAFECQFCNRNDGSTITQIGGNNSVYIPDQFLQNPEWIDAYIYLHTGEDDGETVYKISIPVRERPEPSDITPTPVQQDVITETIAALNEAVDAVPGMIDDALAEAKASGEFDGANGADGNGIWWTNAQVDAVPSSDKRLVSIAYLRGRAEAVPAVDDLVYGPPADTGGGVPTFLYRITEIQGGTAVMVGIGSMKGTNGTNGVGVPTGGTMGQVLRKRTSANYDTVWGPESEPDPELYIYTFTIGSDDSVSTTADAHTIWSRAENYTVQQIAKTLFDGSEWLLPLVFYDIVDAYGRLEFAGSPAAGSMFHLRAEYDGNDWNWTFEVEEVSGGTSDYTDLSNKPQINSVTLSGNKTSSDLGLEAAGNCLPKAGGTMTGDIAMGGYKVTGLAAGAANTDAVNKKQMEDAISNLGEVLDFKGAVATVADLPSTGNRGGDVYLVRSVGAMYVWVETGTGGAYEWDEMGEHVDLSGYIEKPSSPTTNDLLTWNGSTWVGAPAVTEVTNTSTGDVTLALDPGKIYHFTGAISSLTLTLTAAGTGQLAQYHFDFNSGSTAATVSITGVTWPGGSFTPSASKHYEVDILNGYGVVCEW